MTEKLQIMKMLKSGKIQMFKKIYEYRQDIRAAIYLIFFIMGIYLLFRLFYFLSFGV